MSKFTPGPWKYDSEYVGCKKIKGGKAGTHRQAQYKEIANTVGLWSEEEDEANARLIAASPDMYEAFEEIAHLAEYYSLSGGAVEELMGQLNKIFNSAMTALELATGDSDEYV